MPQMDLYDGTTDPLDQLESYEALVIIQCTTDALPALPF